MEKKRTVPSFFIILFFHYTCFSSPLIFDNNAYENPFVLYDNPSLISQQNGLPLGSFIYYNPSTGSTQISAGFIQLFNSSGFSVCYNSLFHTIDNKKQYNLLSTAFSSRYKAFSFGSSFHFIFAGEHPFFNADAGVLYHFDTTKYIGVAMKNFFDVDTSVCQMPRELNISTGGTIPWFKNFNYTVKSITKAYSIKQRKIGYGGCAAIHAYFFDNPSMSIYCSGTFVYNQDSKMEGSIEGDLGYHHQFKQASTGFYAGYRYDIYEKNGSLSFALICNPQHKKKIKQYDVDVRLSSEKITPDGDGIFDDVTISIAGIINIKDITIKQWTVVVTDAITFPNTIVKTFSGGNIPPTSFVWDGRNDKGKIITPGTYYIKIIIVDSLRRVTSSAYKKITVY